MTEAQLLKLKPGDKIRTVACHRFGMSIVDMLAGITMTVKEIINNPMPFDGCMHMVSVVVDNELREKLTAALPYDQSDRQTLHLYSFSIELVAPIKNLHYPHICPKCSGPAYFGAVPAAFECSMRCGR